MSRVSQNLRENENIFHPADTNKIEFFSLLCYQKESLGKKVKRIGV